MAHQDIARVIDVRKKDAKGKSMEEYLVEWKATWEPKENVSIDLPREKVQVIGFVKDIKKPRNDNDLESMDMILKLIPFDGGESRRVTVAYRDVRKRFPDELIQYFEKYTQVV